MGDGRVRVTTRDFVDVALAERGSGRVEDVHTIRLGCLVDTGALMMLLPEDEVGKLGLSRRGRVIVTHADDRREELPTARGLEVSLLGRSMVTDCAIAPLVRALDRPAGACLNSSIWCFTVPAMRWGPRPESPNLPSLQLKLAKPRPLLPILPAAPQEDAEFIGHPGRKPSAEPGIAE